MMRDRPLESMGSRLVQDINPAGSSSPNELTSINGMLFFSAELGTEPSSNSSTDSSDTNADGEDSGDTTGANSRSTTISAGTVGLMRSDGTDDGTTVLGSFDSVTNLVNAGGELYFIAGTNNQYQLWSSDGTVRGTKPVKDLYPDADPNFPQDLFEVDGVLFYSAIDGVREGDDSEEGGGIGKYPYVNGYEVWRREGKGVGSRFFRNLIPDRIITDIEVDEEAEPVYRLIRDENGKPIELTTTTTVSKIVGDDGITTITTTVVNESYVDGKIITTSTTSSEQVETNTENTKIESVTEEVIAVDPQILKKTTTVTTTADTQTGITTTTTVVKEDRVIDGEVQNIIISNEIVQDTTTPIDLNRTTVSIGKSFASEISLPAEITTTTYENDSFPGNFVAINGNYFFTAQSSAFYSLETLTSDTVSGGLDLWFSDGTEAGTRSINVNENIYTFYEPEDGEYSTIDISQPEFGFKQTASSSFPRELTPAKNHLYFVANDGNTGFELWSISDQGSQLSLISDLHPGNTGSSPENLTMVGNTLYFSADEGDGRELYYYKRSLSKPKLVKNAGSSPDSLTAIGNTLYFSAESDLGRELWSAKGDRAKFIKDINPGSESSSPEHFTMTKRVSGNPSKRNKNNYLYFSANDGTHGNELMSLKLNGKRNKVKLESDINDGPRSSLPRDLTIHDQQLFFTANERSKGRELWTVGPSIQGPTGDAGAGTTKKTIFENQTFVFQFSSGQSDQTSWTISGGPDSSLLKINPKNGSLSFRKAPDYEKPQDHNRDGTYELFVRSTEKDSGYKADQEVLINVANKKEKSDTEIDLNANEILYYTAECGPMTANGPLYSCNGGNSGSDSSSDAGGSTGSGGQRIPTVSGNSGLSDEGKSNYNNYNGAIDDYNNEEFIDPCDWAEVARTYADLQLSFESDPTLARHFNQYFATTCDLSQLII